MAYEGEEGEGGVKAETGEDEWIHVPQRKMYLGDNTNRRSYRMLAFPLRRTISIHRW